MLLLFTGSDWCGYCIRLEENVFSDRGFEKYADKNLVLMKADFPKKKQKKRTKEQNQKLKAQFNASGYPSVYIVDTNGNSIDEISGYGGWPAEEYIQKIETILSRNESLTPVP